MVKSMMRPTPWLVAIPIALFIALSLPMVQLTFIPMPGEMQRLIMASESKPDVEPRVHSNIVYTRSFLNRHELDIYEPTVAYDHGSAPVVIFLHGGSWIHGDKVTIRVVDRFLSRMREAGYFVVAVNYATSVFRGLEGPLDNVAHAIRWVVDHAGAYGYDRHSIGLYGVSAGGHLALMTSSTMDRPDFSLAFVFGECAPSDLVALRNGEAFEHSDNLRLFGSSRLESLSPINHVSDRLPPVLLFHGGADQVVAVEQSERYAKAVQAVGVHVEFVRYEDGDHGFLNLPDDVWYQQETRALEFFADHFLSGG
jgi:acetyl esterase/lipase